MALASRVTLKSLTSLSLFVMVLSLMFPLCVSSRAAAEHLGQDARRWSQGQENLIEESCLDCDINHTAILEKCADTAVLNKPRTKD